MNQLKDTSSQLKKHGISSVIAPDSSTATSMMLDMVPYNAVVGIGDSATVRQIKIIDALQKRGTSIINPFAGKFRRNTAVRCLFADIFITGVNAVTLTGELIDMDGAGNRIAGTIFGPETVLIAVGKNKIVRDREEGLKRLRDIAPFHAKGMGYTTPCAETGICTDCNSENRICRIQTVITRAPMYTDMTVFLIDEDLGLSWDAQWPAERIDNIQKGYLRHVWNPSV
jgi:hypothetical protein